MVNNDRIVPVQKIDLLSLYGTILNLLGVGTITVLEADDIEGTFTIPNAEGTFLCNQPVKTFSADSDTGASAVVYFVADYGFTAPTGTEEAFADIAKDATTLYALSAKGINPVTPIIKTANASTGQLPFNPIGGDGRTDPGINY